MCLTNVYKQNNDQQELMMAEVAKIKVKDDGYVLINLFGEEHYVKGMIESIDFIDTNTVMMKDRAS